MAYAQSDIDAAVEKLRNDAEEPFERVFDTIIDVCADAATRSSETPTVRASDHARAGESAAQPVREPTRDASPDEQLLDYIRRGEVDAVLGSGPLAGEVLVVKSRQLEEHNRSLVEALNKEKERLEEFAFATAHDLRGPLSGIESEIAGLLEQPARLRLPLWLVDSLRQIEHAAVRMHLLVSDLMVLGEAGSDSEPVEGVSLFDVVASVLDGYRPQLARGHVNVEIVDDLPQVSARRRHIEAILDNLIDNAVRYASAVSKGKVQIGCRDGDDEIVLWVRDNGPGFDQREADAVFEPYVRLDKRGENTGLGLTIVRNAAKTHGGRAWIDTEPGRGTTACIALPRSCVCEQVHAQVDASL